MALGCAFQGKYEAGDKEGPASEQIHSLFEVLHATAYRKVAHSELDSLREHGARCKHKQQMSARMEGSEPRSPAVPQPPNPLPCLPPPQLWVSSFPPRAPLFSNGQLWCQLCTPSARFLLSLSLPIPLPTNASSLHEERPSPPAARSEGRQP